VHPTYPNFFLAGVPKAGSTSLYRYLDQHPDIYMSPIKEPNFFADEVRVANFSDEFQNRAAQRQQELRRFLAGPMTERCSAGPVENWEDYVRLFENVRGERAIGEASVCYLWSPTAITNILARVPTAKFVIVLRNPIDRALSQYRHMLSFAQRPMTFTEHVQTALASQSTQFSEVYPFLRFGIYGEQLERLFHGVPRERVGVWFYEDYSSNPRGMLKEMFRFLGVDEQFEPDFSERHMEARVPRSYAANKLLRGGHLARMIRTTVPQRIRVGLRTIFFQPRSAVVMTDADCSLLADYYRTDVLKLSALLGRDLSAWLAPRATNVRESEFMQ